MLFTRCPHCDTTFRITAEALSKADGQVRCGRCVKIFNAYAELREQADRRDGARPATSTAEQDTADGPLVPPDGPSSARSSAVETPLAAGAPDDANEPGSATSDATMSTDSIEQIVLEAADDGAETETPEVASSSGAAAASEAPTMTWIPEDAIERARRSPLWVAAAVLALFVLLVQVTHHFRAQFASQPLIGPVVRSAYALLGAPVVPRWDIDQYRIVDWVAMAEPSSTGRGTLAISARIQNAGPKAQPFPHVLVQLKDRWESAIGARVFAPREYLASLPYEDGVMPPGDTVNAKLELIDPGPDAYGFELDVCIEIGDAQLRCATDRVFQ